jgi:enterochelin esterase-like enzyme
MGQASTQTMNARMRIPSLILRALLLAALPAAALAQQPALNSHEVNPDGTLTLRYYAPSAQKVDVRLDYNLNGLPMSKGADGVWTLTTGPLQPALHTYTLVSDGTPVLDPYNSSVEPSYGYLDDEVTVPGAPQLWDPADVPHGVVHHHIYKSAVLKGLPGNDEDYYVYTPPGYDAAAGKPYPVLYLLHGWAGLAGSWTHSGQANLIMDNLIARQTALPMVLVMPLGYGDLAFATSGFGVWSDKEAVGNNLALFGKALLSEIIPQVEGGYRVSARREDRAIAGLSMGGGESLTIGLNHPETFAWVGGFSSAVDTSQADGVFPGLDAKRSPSLLWISCGTSDGLIKPNRDFVAWLRSKALNPVAVETPGIHNWPVWRDNLIHFAPLLFRGAGSP